MAKVNGNKKGKTYERKLAKLFTEYWGVKFGRTVGSGSYRGVNEDLQTSDIVPERGHKFPFAIEAKHREGGWTLESIPLGKHDIKNWWSQVIGDANKAKLNPLLIFTRNYAEDFVMLVYHEPTEERLIKGGQPVMTTTVTYDIEITQSTHTWKVLVTTLDGFMSLPKEHYIEHFYRSDEWRNGEIEVKAPEKKTLQEQATNILDSMFEAD